MMEILHSDDVYDIMRFAIDAIRLRLASDDALKRVYVAVDQPHVGLRQDKTLHYDFQLSLGDGFFLTLRAYSWINQYWFVQVELGHWGSSMVLQRFVLEHAECIREPLEDGRDVPQTIIKIKPTNEAFVAAGEQLAAALLEYAHDLLAERSMPAVAAS